MSFLMTGQRPPDQPPRPPIHVPIVDPPEIRTRVLPRPVDPPPPPPPAPPAKK